MTDKTLPSSPPLTLKKYSPDFKGGVRTLGGRRYTANQRSPCSGRTALLGYWQRQELAETMPSRTERDEIKRLRAGLIRVKQERDIL